MDIAAMMLETTIFSPGACEPGEGVLVLVRKHVVMVRVHWVLTLFLFR